MKLYLNYKMGEEKCNSESCHLENEDFHLFLLKEVLDEPQVKTLLYLADLLEMCQFKVFWQQIHAQVN